MKKKLKKFEEIIKEKKLIDASLEILQWDLETTAPKKGKELIADVFGYLSMKSYNLMTSEEFIKLVEKLSEKKEKLNDIQRKEIDGINRLLKEGKKEITEEEFSKYMYRDIPDPELLIRTSGELRISNFLLWQIAYSEIYITDTLWPDFDEKELEKAIESYNKRDRRFGGVK